jgi:hypothetical protein
MFHKNSLNSKAATLVTIIFYFSFFLFQQTFERLFLLSPILCYQQLANHVYIYNLGCIDPFLASNELQPLYPVI